jgi:ribosome-associated protein
MSANLRQIAQKLNARSTTSKNKIISSNLVSIPTRRTKQPLLEQLNHLIVEGIRDKKGKNIVQLDLRKLGDAPADFFIICEGDSNTHVKAITDSIHKKVKEELQSYPTHMEGSSNSKWVLMDYFNTVVHVFHPETRHFYELEHLWSDAEVTEFGEV